MWKTVTYRSPLYHSKKYKDNNEKSTKTNSRRAIVKNIVKDVKKMKRAFTMVNNQLQQLKEDESDMTYSEKEDEASHFHIDDCNVGKSGFQFSQLKE